MKLIKSLLYLCIVVLSMLSCSSESDEVVFYFYNETLCSDPWQMGADLDEKKVFIEDYLENEGIGWSTLRVDNVPGLAEPCEACICLSGYRYYINLDNSTSEELEVIGFQLVN